MAKVLHLTLRVEDERDLIGDVDSAGEELAELISGYWQGAEVTYLSGLATPAPEPPHVTIRHGKYRSPLRGPGTPDEGYIVRSSRGDSIFTGTRASAERIAARLRNGEEPRLADYQL